MTDRLPDEQLALDEATLRRLLEAGRSLVKLLDLERILDNLLGVATELTGARYAAIGVLNEERSGLERFVTHGIDADTHRAIGELPRGRGVLGVLITDPRRCGCARRRPSAVLRLPGLPSADEELPRSADRDPRRGVGQPLPDREAGDGEFTAADEQTVMVLADWAGIAIDNARLFEASRARKDELERAVQGLEATTTIARAIGTETDLDRVLELIVKRGRALVEARSLVLLLAEGDELTSPPSAGQVQSRAVRLPDPDRGDRGRRGAASARARAHERRADDAQARATRARRGGRGDRACSSRSCTAARRSACSPHSTAWPASGEFDDDAGIAAGDVRGERRDRGGDREDGRARAAARLAEGGRERAPQVGARAARRDASGSRRPAGPAGVCRAGSRAATVDEAVGVAVQQIQEQIEGLRTLITELRPAALDQLGLKPALESLLERLGTVEGLDVAGELDARLRSASIREIETTIYRFVQEALTNVAKHARAEHVRVRLTSRARQRRARDRRRRPRVRSGRSAARVSA